MRPAALPGTSAVVNHASCPSVSSRRVPCTVTPIGRVCGAAIGIAVIPTTSRTASRSDELLHGRGEAFPLGVRLGPGEQQDTAGPPYR